MDGADEDGWSAVAQAWSELWGGLADPARRAIVTATEIGPGTRVLDMGCGSGEFIVLLRELGAEVAGIDPAPAMVDAARRAASGADIRLGSFDPIPCTDASFEVVTAVNSLQFADDPVVALREVTRVTVPGGFVAIANWAEGARNDLDTIERAVAEAAGDELAPDGPLRIDGGLEQVMEAAGLEVTSTGLVDVPWEVDDADALVRGVLLGEDRERMRELASTVEAAALPFRVTGGRYRLMNAFRVVVARTPTPGRCGPEEA